MDIDAHLKDNPSLKAGLSEAISFSYRRALIEAERETGLETATFPSECPWSFDQMMADDFWPKRVANSQSFLEPAVARHGVLSS